MAESVRPLRIGWYSTGRGPGSRALLGGALDAIRAGRLAAEIAFVFCNRERGQDPNSDQFLDLAEGAGITTVTLSDRAFRRARGGQLARLGEPLPAWRAEYDREMLALTAGLPVDVCVLAGYMLILWPDTTTVRPFLNLHPAAPGGPKGPWQEVIWQLIEAGAAHTGAMIQVATPALDEGPVVSYFRFPIRGPHFDPLWDHVAGRSAAELRAQEGEDLPLFQAIRRHGAEREQPLVIGTLAALAAGRARVRPCLVTDPSGNPFPGLDLSAEVNAIATMPD